MYLNIYSWTTTPWVRYLSPQRGKIAEMCKLYKIPIKAFSLLPLMMDYAGMGVGWCLSLHSPSPGSVGERWGGRKNARRRVGKLISLSFPKRKPGCSHEPQAPSYSHYPGKREEGFTDLTGGGTWGHTFHPPAQKCLNQPSGDTHGAPGTGPPPCPSKAKSLLVKFPAPERRAGRGCSGQCWGRKAQTSLGSSRDAGGGCMKTGVGGGGGGWEEVASQGEPFAPWTSMLSGSLLLWLCIFNIRMFAEVRGLLRDRKWCGAKCREVSQILKDWFFSPSQDFLTLIPPTLSQKLLPWESLGKNPWKKSALVTPGPSEAPQPSRRQGHDPFTLLLPPWARRKLRPTVKTIDSTCTSPMVRADCRGTSKPLYTQEDRHSEGGCWPGKNREIFHQLICSKKTIFSKEICLPLEQNERFYWGQKGSKLAQLVHVLSILITTEREREREISAI